MAPRKDPQLRKKMALEAAQRWQSRQDIRAEPETLRITNPVEYELHVQRTRNFMTREENRPATTIQPRKLRFRERIVGPTNDLSFIAPSAEALKAGMPVARLQTIPPDGFQPEGFATGFMVSPQLLLTNHHVFPDAESAKNCSANFAYERTASGLQLGFPFALNPERYYFSDEKLDYALVYVEPTSLTGKMSLRNFNFVPLIATKGKVIVGQPVTIIQHPAGAPKQYAFTNSNILDIIETEGLIHYSTDTLEGSSGAPTFNQSWEVAALHHQGIPFVVNGQIMTIKGQPWDENTMSEDDIQWIANEGISISRIVEHIRSRQPSDTEEQKLWQELLELTKDPLFSGKAGPPKQESILIPPNALSNPANNANMTPSSNPSSGVVINVYAPATIQIGGPFASATGASSIGYITPVGGAPVLPPPFIEKKQLVDPDYDNRPGYAPDFLHGFNIELPHVITTREHELFVNLGTHTPFVLDYHHFSLVMNKDRRFLMWSASNVDYNPEVKSSKSRKEFGTESWIPDPLIPVNFQIVDEEFYKPATNIDRGHIVRREDNCWGETERGIEYANADTYHWTNCTPQHERFNQFRDDGYKGLWGRLESHLQNQLTLVDNRAILFAGPVLNENDPAEDFGLGSIQYPLKYWKVVVVNEAEAGLSAYGFILDQSNVIADFGLKEAMLDFNNFKAQQVSIAAISNETGVLFDQQVYNADVMLMQPDASPGMEVRKSFRTAAEILVKKKRS